MNPGFSLPGYLGAGPSNITPIIPSLTVFHQVLSTWPNSAFTPSLTSPQLNINQVNSLFRLATGCQALGVKLAKQFQVLSGLKALHHNSIQGTVQESLTVGCSTREATYSTILWDNISKSEHETMTHHLCSEADAAWKVSHEVMYNHQLQYNQQLTTFLAEAETALSDMQDEVWATTRALAENDGVMFNACLRLTHSQLAPTASCRHFIPDADTPHHHLLP